MIVGCKYCSSDHKIRSCPVYGKTCNRYKKIGHFAKCSKSKKKKNCIDTDELVDDNDSNTLFIDSVMTLNSN